MANYYTQFSFAFPVPSPEGRAWIDNALDSGWESIADDPDLPPEFEWEWVEEAGVPHLWIYTQETGSPENAALLVQAYLKAFNLKDRIGFEYACTCSKPRWDAFGGGALVVSAQAIAHEDAASVLDRLLNEEKK